MRIAVGTLAVLVVSAGLCGSGNAQTAGNAGPNCLFPLACPGPVPPKPEPLYGTPEEQAAAQPAEPTSKPKHRVRKHVAKKAH